MTTRYQKSQIEDVAVLLHFHHDIKVSGPVTIATLAGHFADLFAADNPSICFDCGVTETEATAQLDAGGTSPCKYSYSHRFAGGFDRERFLKDCGLEAE